MLPLHACRVTATHLLAIVDTFRERADLSDAAIANRLGITRQALHAWRRQGLRALPAQATLDRLATVTAVAYESVLSAALVDAGYLRAGQALSGVAPSGDATSAVVSGAQLRDLYREDFDAWTETPVAVYDSRGRFVTHGPLTSISLAVAEHADAPRMPFYSFESSGVIHRWQATDRCTIFGPHPAVPEHMSGGRSGTDAAVSELRIGDYVTAWRGNGLRVLRVVGLSPAADEWGDVRLDFIDGDSGERITHPNMNYEDSYTRV